MVGVAENIPTDVLINLNSAKIIAGGTTDLTGFDDPRNIINRTDGIDGAGKTWLLADNTAGYWEAKLTRVGTPSLLRLSNTKQDGRGTKAFAISWSGATTNNNPPGLANLTYTDPQTGKAAFCTDQCPLAASSNKSYQDFLFVNIIKLDNIRLNVTQWYGAGGGLDGLLLAESRERSWIFLERLILMVAVVRSFTNHEIFCLKPILHSFEQSYRFNFVGSLRHESRSIELEYRSGCHNHCHSSTFSIKRAFVRFQGRHSYRRHHFCASPPGRSLALASEVPQGRSESSYGVSTSRPPVWNESPGAGREHYEN